MDTSKCRLDAVLAAEPSNAQLTRKVQYVNESGIELSIHTPSGEFYNIPPRQVSHPRMLLSVYVTYTLSSTVGINGITESDNSSYLPVVSNINNAGTVTLKYELNDFSKIMDGGMVLLEPLNIGVLRGRTDRNQYPENTPMQHHGPALTFSAGNSEGYFVHNRNMIRFLNEDETHDTAVYVVCGDYKQFIGTWEGCGLNLPFLLTKNEQQALKLRGDNAKALLEEVKFKDVEKTNTSNTLMKNVLKQKEMVIDNISNIEDVETRRIAAEQKFVYDSRGLARKDTSEAIKWAPALASGVGVMVGMLL